MTVGEQIAAAIMGVSGFSSIGCAIRAYLPIRSAHEAAERVGPSLDEAFGDTATEPLPADLAGLLADLDKPKTP